ncbi:SpoIIE family protein phosphatase [Actinoplanes sp. Pm04-4]|uniref:SpoIIE family protein phosphatase n=2 Tax=Paractinoplanes pyxinae TaxID=2997416 RepID=A0ABT4BB17_9ACTN|nr:SpoIIE family protein phosphatase [Actinoplanes pyxinae]
MFDQFATMVRAAVRVPVALVSLVEPGRQIFPGALGLAEPWQQTRQTPLSHSFCQHVVTDARPLVISDARTDSRVKDNLAIDELGVIAYAGMPLTDTDGNVLGSLCAIDTQPRQWAAAELELLTALAAACSESLRLRIETVHARRDERAARAAAERGRLLLRASTMLSAAVTTDDAVTAVTSLLTEVTGASRVSLVPIAGTGPEPATVIAHHALKTGELVELPAVSGSPGRADVFAAGWQAAAAVPLPETGGRSRTALLLTWNRPRTLSDDERALLTALAGDLGHALRRAAILDDRRTAAATLQLALLTELPKYDHVQMAARYRPAQHADHVGGDWYDAIVVDRNRVALVIGDATGHNIQAAAAMSQLRGMLRTLLVDRQEQPSAVLRRLELTSRTLGTSGLASLIVAYLDTHPGGGHRLTWSNAGHPPPVIAYPDGTTTVLPVGDPLIGAVRHASRRNHTMGLPAGSTMLLYTDGLIETRGQSIDDGIADLRNRLIDALPGPPDVVADALMTAGGTYRDDVAVLAVGLPAQVATAPSH